MGRFIAWVQTACSGAGFDSKRKPTLATVAWGEDQMHSEGFLDGILMEGCW